jgi:DNA end-binding protein Ku
MRAKWKPDQYKDEYRHDVLELIQKKIKSGKVHEITKPKEPSARGRARSEIVDLMPLLKKSLAQRSESPKSARRSTTAKRTRTNSRAGAGTRARRHA